MFSLYVPEPGCRHELILLRKSGCEPILDEFTVVEGVQYVVYGEIAYVLRRYLAVPFPGEAPSTAQARFITEMEQVGVSVELDYKRIKQLW